MRNRYIFDLNEADARRLEALSQFWELTRADTIRRALREATDQHLGPITQAVRAVDVIAEREGD